MPKTPTLSMKFSWNAACFMSVKLRHQRSKGGKRSVGESRRPYNHCNNYEKPIDDTGKCNTGRRRPDRENTGPSNPTWVGILGIRKFAIPTTFRGFQLPLGARPILSQ